MQYADADIMELLSATFRDRVVLREFSIKQMPITKILAVCRSGICVRLRSSSIFSRSAVASRRTLKTDARSGADFSRPPSSRLSPERIVCRVASFMAIFIWRGAPDCFYQWPFFYNGPSAVRRDSGAHFFGCFLRAFVSVVVVKFRRFCPLVCGFSFGSCRCFAACFDRRQLFAQN